MTGAMYAAISGLKAHMNKLNVIGNNIANVNTYGYKTQRAVFSDSIYTTMSAGSDGTDVAGAVNPSQIGYGVEMSSVDLDMSSGTFSPTGRDMDCMIMGDGFFLVGDKGMTFDDSNAFTKLALTRVGTFEFRSDGYLSDANGNVVYGFLSTGIVLTAGEGEDAAPVETTVFSNELVPISLPRLKSVLDPQTNQPTGEMEVVYPSYGADAADNSNLPFVGMDSIAIDPVTGMITGTCKDTKEIITIGVIAMGNVTNPNGVTHTSGPYYKAGEGAGDLQISLMGGVAADMKICNNPPEPTPGTDTLVEVTDFLYIGGGDSTQGAEGMRIYSAGTTELMTGGLEMSKTDLATEISEMITTQRGYQANTRIITVTDSMLEELVNIKR